MDDSIKFSLLIGTLDRPEILMICLNKLKEQTYKNFEVIIIDQSDNDKTEQAVKTFSGIDIKYKKVNFKGLSKARNVAIRQMSGDYFCLIDDDADYSNRYLENIVNVVRKNSNAIVSGYILDTSTKKGIVNYNKIKNRENLTLREAIRLCPSAGLTFPSSTVEMIGLFDEKFGVGTNFGAGEETDYILRCRKQGYRILHSSEIYAEHPIVINKKLSNNGSFAGKVRSYAKGIGAIYKKHLVCNNEYELIPVFVDAFARLIVKKMIQRSDVANARYYGFLEGWKQYHSEVKESKQDSNGGM